ncbi:Mur ligase family protein [Rubrivivax rivuli]|uniref:Mur ligase n=1 Tax=Rubrivivax rivuli TaxID=1862385 RepID=A0A437RRG7_9BURK|nr:Mur ligase family protein [Rubrivivax rivuli]RVU49285.1 Mur ligase [Rubrivivax rivuli]
MHDDDEGPPPAFESSRRLTGPNRWFSVPAVALTPLGAAAADPSALSGWQQRVQALCAALGWPAPQTHVATGAAGTVLAFVPPEAALLTATDLNEWAWERAAEAHAPLAAQGFALTQPACDDIDAMARHFRAKTAAEASRPLQRLQAAAHAHGLPLFDDDDSVSIGIGSGSRTWPRAVLPLPMDVPWSQLHAQPVLLVTGSNGKTTTTRLLVAMAEAAGRVAGHCSTEGVVVGGQPVHTGDYAGPAGARAVLRHPAVQFAVLETARGGLLRRGLVARQADAAIVTNVSADHLGEYGIASVEDIAEAKLVVAHALREHGTLVLNGGDAVLMAVARRTPHVQALFDAGRVALFAHDLAHPLLQAHRATGAPVCGSAGGELVWAQGDVEASLGEISQMPLTLQGAARHNIENIAAAVLAALAGDLPLPALRATLAQFGAAPQDNPGRLERWPWRGATVLVDYAHNPDGLAQLLQVAQALKPVRLGLLLGQAGNRDDAAIAGLAQTAARFAPARVVVKELPQMLRGRALGEVPALLAAALHQADLPAHALQHEPDEKAAALALLAWAQPGDVVVLPVHTTAVRQALAQVLAQGTAAGPGAETGDVSAPTRTG